jgi:hypothetical protein
LCSFFLIIQLYLIKTITLFYFYEKLFLFSISKLLGYSQESKYLKAKMKLIEGHKTVAILPFKATIAYKIIGDIAMGLKKVEELAMGSQMQSGLYTYL